MKIVILSDIHANYPALEAVLQDIVPFNVEKFWLLGDVVGYGPHPVDVLLWLKQYKDHIQWVLGNHDAMLANQFTAAEWDAVGKGAKSAIALNKASLEKNNDQAREALEFFRSTFNNTNLKLHCRLDEKDYILFHGAQTGQRFMRTVFPWQEEIYLPAELHELAAHMEADSLVGLTGHSHVPMLVLADQNPEDHEFSIKNQKIHPGRKYDFNSSIAIINPGSVGQPRDMDRRAAYAILDTKEHTILFRRVEYDWHLTAQDMQDQDYSESLVLRLRTAQVPKDIPANWLEHFLKMKEIPCGPV